VPLRVRQDLLDHLVVLDSVGKLGPTENPVPVDFLASVFQVHKEAAAQLANQGRMVSMVHKASKAKWETLEFQEI
jgi:hypothetical protein